MGVCACWLAPAAPALRMLTMLAATALAVSSTAAQLPAGPPVYQLNLSTIIMPCNDTGPTDPASTKGWGVIDFDWCVP
jgi:hypothetical protein